VGKAEKVEKAENTKKAENAMEPHDGISVEQEVVDTTKSGQRQVNKSPARRLLRRICLIFAGILLIVVILFVIVYFDKLRSMVSVKKISDAPAYYVHVYGDYYLDEYLETGAKSPTELSDFLYKKLTFGLYKGELVQEHGCSSFYSVTPEGDRILAQNLDLSVPMHMPIVAEYENKNHMIGITDMVFLTRDISGMSIKNRLLSCATPFFSMNGMNEHGLAIAVATCDTTVIGRMYNKTKTDKVTILDTSVATAVLDNAVNVEEAVEFLSKFNIIATSNGLSHFMLADADGNSAVVEWNNSEMQVLERSDDYQIMANFKLYNNSSLKGFGSDRYKNYDKFLSSSKGIISEEDAMELLIENTIPGDEDWSVIYNLTQRKVSVSFYGDYDNLYTFGY
jgi:hypothetical protein